MSAASKRRLEGKIAIITGAAQGIGRAAALAFAREGAVVFVADVNAEGGEAAAREIQSEGGQAAFVRADVSSPADVQALVRAVRERSGRLDVLYNNASVYLAGRDGRIVEVEEQVWDRVIAVNLKSVYLCCRFAIPLMIASGGGAIINTASSAALIGIPNCDAYTATKGATVALTRSLAVEYRPHNIRVNCIAPAGIQTPMLGSSNLEDSSFDERAFLELRTPSRRYGRPEEVAALAVFLASEEASYVNGAVVVADGGITINGDLSRVGGR